MKISIALASYNGSTYIKEQLDSFLMQTRLPDELIISDDVSSDNTVEIINNFINEAPFRVVLIKNDVNLGFTRNFEKAIQHCTGDLIFISDQDDFWLPNKIEYMSTYMQNHPGLFIAVNNTEITDKNLTPTGITKISQVKRLQGGLSGFIPGCCSVFRSNMCKLYLPFSAEYQSYDGWLHFIGSTIESRDIVFKVLQYYRLHGSNTSEYVVNVKRELTIFDRFKYIWKRVVFDRSGVKKISIEQQIALCEILKYKVEGLLSESPLDSSMINNHNMIVSKVDMLKYRLKIMEKGRLGRMVALLKIDSRKHKISFKTMISDFIG